MRIIIYTAVFLLVLLQSMILTEIHKLNQIEIVTPTYKPIKKSWVKSEIIEMLAYKAIENDIKPKYLIALANCESSLNPTVQSKFKQSYGQEQSFGLFQIHLKAHKNVTVEQAKDPVFNAKWAIEEIKKGKAPRHWVRCHKVASSVK